MVDGGGEFAELPFLEIDPAEKLFEFISDSSLHGNRFRSSLYGRAVSFVFGTYTDSGGPDWVIISSTEPERPEIEIGYMADSDCGTTYFHCGGNSCFTDDDLIFGHSDESKRQAILEFLECTLTYGYVTYSDQLNGPLWDNYPIDNWFQEWRKDLKAAFKRISKHKPKSTLEGNLAGVLVGVILLPLLVVIIPYGLVRELLIRAVKRPHRYPPYPLD